MLRSIKSRFLLFVLIVLLIFSVHFIIGMIYRANPDPKISDRFDAYLRPGILILLLPFRLAEPIGLLSHVSWPTFILGTYVYFGAMLGYSVLFALILFGIYEVLRKVVTWKH